MTSTNLKTARKLSIELTATHYSQIAQIAHECATSENDIISEAIVVYLNTPPEEIDAKLKQQSKACCND
jgi:hypothetical protein